MAWQSDDQRTVQMHRFPRSSLALPNLTHEQVKDCQPLPDSWPSSSTMPTRRAVVEIPHIRGESTYGTPTMNQTP
jgi:hypothetical protein